jgi:hypothetical protein
MIVLARASSDAATCNITAHFVALQVRSLGAKGLVEMLHVCVQVVRKLKKAQRMKNLAKQSTQAATESLCALNGSAGNLDTNNRLPSLRKPRSPLADPPLSSLAAQQDIATRIKTHAEHLQRLLTLPEETSVNLTPSPSEECEQGGASNLCGSSRGQTSSSSNGTRRRGCLSSPDRTALHIADSSGQVSISSSGARRRGCLSSRNHPVPNIAGTWSKSCQDRLPTGEGVKSYQAKTQQAPDTDPTKAASKPIDMTYRSNRPFRIAAHAQGVLCGTRHQIQGHLISSVFSFKSRC